MDKILSLLQYLARFSRPVAHDTWQQPCEHYQISAFRYPWSQATVGQFWYDLSFLPVLIMADATGDISSALQQLYLLNSQVIRDLG